MRHAQVKLRLTIDVVYSLYGAEVAELKRTLINASQHLEDNCLLSGETAACVEHWESTAVELQDPANAVNKVL